MPKKKRNTYHHGNLRATLLETTAKMIVEEGIHNVSMRSLSQKIGVSRTAPYRHFTDKSALLAAVAQQGFKLLQETLHAASESRGTPVKRFEKMALAYVDFALTNPAYYKLMFGEEMASDSPPEFLLAAAMATLEEAVVVIKDCQNDGSFHKGKGSTTALANVSWSTLHGLSNLLLDGQIRSGNGEKLVYGLDSDHPSAAAIKRLAKVAIKVLVKGMK